MNFNDYAITAIYPEKPEEPVLDLNFGSDNLIIHIQKLNHYLSSMRVYEKEKKVCEQEDRQLMQKFKTDVLKECGLSNNVESESMYLKAWQNGHTYGLSEVYSILKTMGILETVK